MISLTGTTGLAIYTILENAIIALVIFLVVLFYHRMKNIDENTRKTNEILSEIRDEINDKSHGRQD